MGENTTEVKYPSCYITLGDRCSLHELTTHVNVNYLIKVAFTRFLHCNFAIFLSPYSVSFWSLFYFRDKLLRPSHNSKVGELGSTFWRKCQDICEYILGDHSTFYGYKLFTFNPHTQYNPLFHKNSSFITSDYMFSIFSQMSSGLDGVLRSRFLISAPESSLLEDLLN